MHRAAVLERLRAASESARRSWGCGDLLPALLRGESATINGDGKYIRDYVYVTDVAEANFQALTAPAIEPFRPYNVGTGIGVDTNQIGGAIYDECVRLVGDRQKVPDCCAAQLGRAICVRT